MADEKIVWQGNFMKVVIAENGHEIVVAPDAAIILIYIEDKEQIVFVKQCRPAMVTEENPTGEILELPAGLFDGDYTPKGLMVKEAFEEAGVTLKEEDIELMNSGMPIALASGMTTSKLYIGYAFINSNRIDNTRFVFGEEGTDECIQRVLMPVKDLAKPITYFSGGTMMALEAFLRSIGI